jgi:Carboxypeptidase regulatory-like domain
MNKGWWMAGILAVLPGGAGAQAPTAPAPSATGQAAPVTPISPDARSTPPAPPATEQPAPASQAASAQTTAQPDAFASRGGTVRGVIKSGPTSLPGVTVTAKNTLTGQQYVTATDIHGGFTLHVPEDGRYVVRAEFAAFAPATKEVVLHGGSQVEQADLNLMLASRQQQLDQAAARRPGGGPGGPGGAFGAGGPRQYQGGGAQSLALLGGALGAISSAGGGEAGLPAGAGSNDFSSDSVTVAGQSGTTNPLANINADQVRDNFENLQQQQTLAQIPGQRQNGGGGFGGGGFGGGFGGGGGGFGGRGGGNFRRLNPNKPHGAIFWSGGNSLFDAKPFSLRGQQEEQPQYNSNRFGVVFAGAPYIPHLVEHDTKDFFFVSLIGNRSSTPFDQYGTVPDANERIGNFSQLTQGGQAVPIYDPLTGQPFPGNVIPASRISTQAAALLAFIPLPNLSTPNRQNYQRLTSATTNTTTVGVRYVRSFGGGTAASSLIRQFTGASAPGLSQNINVNYNYSHSGADELNLFPSLGGKQQVGQHSAQLGYTLGVNKLTNNLTANLNRTDTELRNLFTGQQDIASAIGVNVLSGAALNPLNYGLPNVTLVQFSGLSEQQPNFQTNQTLGVSESSSWLHGKHNIKFGGDYKRVELNLFGQSNSTGTFTFTGFASEQPGSQSASGTGSNSGSGQPSTGSSLADLLLGAPQQTAIQAPYQKAYLRANIYDGFVQDDWRLRPNFTVLAGLRYEYFSPYAEKDGRLATIDPSSDFTQVAPVIAGGVGTFTGPYPKTLIRPDRTSVSPRVGFAWRAAKNTVVRGGYAINYANGQYISFIQNLAFQPPFADVQTNQATAGAPITLANGFLAPQTEGNYSVNKDYRLPYVQVWNVDVQRTLPHGVVLNVGWNGAKGTRLNVLTAPGRTADASISGVYYNYSNSIGFSNYNAGTVRLRRRLQNGIAVGATYTYSHAIDDASSIGGNGGTAAVVAQNSQNILAEESNSSFDIRHNLKGDFVYELPLGPDAHYLTGGNWLSHGFSNLSVSGTFGIATGEPLTPHFAANIADVARASNGSLRPNRVPGVSLTAGGGSLDRWFNTDAFSSNFAPGQIYGTASRNSIPGPGTITFNASVSKTIKLGDTRSFEMRGTANNAFNTIQYAGVDTQLGSNTYGQVTSAAATRTFTLLGRFRY